MNIYVLLAYMTYCREYGQAPTWEHLRRLGKGTRA